MVYYDPRKPKPWPIRLLNKIGVINDTVATNIVILISIILLVIILFQLIELQEDNTVERNLTSEQLQELGL